MQGPYLIPFIPDIPIQVHQAGPVGGNDIIGARFQGIVQFLIGHGDGNGLELYGKTAPEPATGFHIIHFQQFQPFYMGQQLPGFFLDLAFPQTRAGASFTVPALNKLLTCTFFDR